MEPIPRSTFSEWRHSKDEPRKVFGMRDCGDKPQKRKQDVNDASKMSTRWCHVVDISEKRAFGQAENFRIPKILEWVGFGQASRQRSFISRKFLGQNYF